MLVAIFTRMNVQLSSEPLLYFRAQRLAVESIAAVSNSIANRTPDTRTIRIHTPNYQLIPLLPFESGHLPRKKTLPFELKKPKGRTSAAVTSRKKDEQSIPSTGPYRSRGRGEIDRRPILQQLVARP